MIRLVFIILITACFLAGSKAQKPDAAAHRAPECQGNVRQNPKVMARVAEFLDELQAAIAANDRDHVASLIHYPLRVATKDRRFIVRSKADLIDQYDRIFPPEIKNVLMSEQPDCANISSRGPLMFGDGTVWFNSFAGEKLSTSGEFKIITINPPLPPSAAR